MSSVCEHGHLRRQCIECELRGVIVNLHAALEAAMPYLYDCKAIGGYKKGLLEHQIKRAEEAIKEGEGYVHDYRQEATPAPSPSEST
jgi:hypothetical protein